MTDYFGLSYASFTLLGGLIGFLKAGSTASLVASSVVASAIYYGVHQNQKLNGNPKVIVGVSAFLFLYFGDKYRKTGKPMPGAILSLYSLVSLIYYGRELL